MVKSNTLNYGIGGIRAKFGQFPMTDQAIFCLGKALGVISREISQGKVSTVITIRDTRQSCQKVFQSLGAGLAQEQTKVVECGVLPTPAALTLLKTFPEASLAVVISASHNTAEFNGIKVFGHSGKLSTDQTLALNTIFDFFYSNSPEQTSAPKQAQFQNKAAEAEAAYIEDISTLFCPRDFDGIGSVALDCANGAASIVGPKIFSALEIRTKIINNQPNGTNINLACGSTHPKALSQFVLDSQCKIGFCLDGDSDRVLAINQKGQIKDGDDFLAALGTSKDFKKTEKIVGTVMSNSALEVFLAKHGKTLLRSNVGESNILKVMQSEGSNLGAEPSGHILIGNTDKSSDGIKNALKILRTANTQSNLELKTFDKFFSKLIGIQTSHRLPLESGPIHEAISEYSQLLYPGRIFPRYSETESLFRLLVESPEKELGESISTKLETKLKKIFEQVEPKEVKKNAKAYP